MRGLESWNAGEDKKSLGLFSLAWRLRKALYKYVSGINNQEKGCSILMQQSFEDSLKRPGKQA